MFDGSTPRVIANLRFVSPIVSGLSLLSESFVSALISDSSGSSGTRAIGGWSRPAPRIGEAVEVQATVAVAFALKAVQ
jgi:hypothetical protein